MIAHSRPLVTPTHHSSWQPIIFILQQQAVNCPAACLTVATHDSGIVAITMTGRSRSKFSPGGGLTPKAIAAIKHVKDRACIALIGALRLYRRTLGGRGPSLPRELALCLTHGLGLGAIFLVCAMVCWFVGEVASGGQMPEEQLWVGRIVLAEFLGPRGT